MKCWLYNINYLLEGTTEFELRGCGYRLSNYSVIIQIQPDIHHTNTIDLNHPYSFYLICKKGHSIPQGCTRREGIEKHVSLNLNNQTNKTITLGNRRLISFKV